MWAAAALGKTLVERDTNLTRGIVACGNCHSPPGGPLADKELSGRLTFDEPPFKAYALNITPDEETGIGKWTDAEIKRAITTGGHNTRTRLRPPMGFANYKNVRDEDLDALIAYLRSLKPVGNAVRRGTAADACLPLPSGERLAVATAGLDFRGASST